MNEAAIQVYIKAAFSASFLVSESDGEITADEVGAFMQALRELHDFDLDEEEVWESFRDALQLDEEEHLSRVAGAAGLSEELRREILNIALAVAAADGEFSLSEILCLPDIAAALGIELGEGDEDEDKGEDEADTEIEDEADSEASGKFAASLREAEAALKAEGNPAPSKLEILSRAMSSKAAELNATVSVSRGAQAWESGEFERARQLYLEAAEAGDSNAMYNLGQMYMAGDGMPVDWAEALSWWLLAAEKGNVMAQRNAWKTLRWGEPGVTPDKLRAFEIARMAAAQGDEESSQYVLETVQSRRSEMQLSALIAANLMAAADGEVSDGELAAFGGYWKDILGVDYTIDELREVFADNLSDSSSEQEMLGKLSVLARDLPLDIRNIIMRASVLVAFSEGNFPPEQQAMAERIGAALDIDLSDLGGGWGLKRVGDAEPPEEPAEPAAEVVYDPQINPVLVAAMNGDIGKVRTLLSEGYSATDIHISGTDALILAVREGHMDIVEILVDGGADPDRMNPKSGMTPLRMAVQQTRVEIAEYLLSKGADADRFDEASGAGPLAVLVMKAAELDEAEALHLLDLLVAAGAKQRPLRGNGSVHSLIGIAAMKQGLPVGFLRRLAEAADQKDVHLALWEACVEGIPDNVRELIVAGADVNMTVLERAHNPSAVGNCPIITAANLGHVECVRLLIEAGADVNRNAPPEGGQFALLMAAEFGHPEIVRMLLDAGADLAMVNPQNGTHSLGGAVVRGHAEIVSLLLKAGADPNIQTEGYDGCQLLTFAARDGYADIVRLLIEFGAEVDATGSERVHTALILAAHQGHAEVVSLLLDHGADVNKAHPVSGSDALLQAVKQGRTQCVRLLLQAGGDADRTYQTEAGHVSILSVASAKGDTEIVRLLLEHGADLNAEGGDGHTALNVAAHQGHAGVVSVLLDHGADPLKINPVNGSDALLPAVTEKQVECVRLLLQAGANPGRTYPGELSSGGSRHVPILIIASETGDAEIVRLLLEYGADINADVGDGMTALRRAGVNSYKDVEQVLIEFGADPSTRLVKFTDTPAGREMENEVLSRLAAGLEEVASKIRTLEAGDTPDEAEPETRPRGFFAGLFGWGRRP